jgi:hypothetical protein
VKFAAAAAAAAVLQETAFWLMPLVLFVCGHLNFSLFEVEATTSS